MKWCVLGALPNTTMTRYCVLDRSMVIDVTVSQPGEDVDRVDRPAVLRFRQSTPADVQIKRWRINETPVNPAAGEQPRRPVWKRAGKRANGGVL